MTETWRRVRLVFRVCSPLHVGWRRVQNLMMTRPYLPGRNLWAALVEQLTLRYTDAGDADYKKAQEFVSDNFRFSHFWTAVPKSPDVCDATAIREPDDLLVVLPPDLSDKGNELSCYFDYLFLDGRAMTALKGTTAAEGTLHEVEFIRPWTRPIRLKCAGRPSQPVFLVGDMWCKEDANNRCVWVERCRIKAFWNHIGSTVEIVGCLRELQVGGERTYGFGRLQLACWRAYETNPRPVALLPCWRVVDGYEVAVEPLLGRSLNKLWAYKDGESVIFVTLRRQEDRRSASSQELENYL